MKIQNVKCEVLKFAEYNPRTLSTDQFEHLKKSIEKFDFILPILVNSNPKRKNVIVGGHQRVRVALMMGIETVPVIYTNQNPTDEKELNIRLNKNGGSWDNEKLANEFDSQKLLDWGFSPFEIGGFIESEDEEQEQQQPPQSNKTGLSMTFEDPEQAQKAYSEFTEILDRKYSGASIKLK